ncbi:phage tail tape measure protein, partial [Halolactibacillus halophilus]
MKGFGLEADEAFDLMAKGAQNGLNFSNEMFDNLSEYSTLFGNMGYSAEEYFELLQKGTEAGVYNLDYINDVMKEFQIRVKDGSKTTSDAMDQLSEETQTVWKEFNKGDKTVKDVSNAVLKELKGMDDQVSANQIGVELFGTKFEDLESEAMYALGDIGEGLEDVDGTMDDMTKNAEKSISQQWKSTWREAKEVLLPVGETLLDFTREVLPDVKDSIEGVTQWFEELDEEGKKNIIMIGGIAAVAGPAISAFGSLSSGVGGLLKVGGSLSTLFGKAGGAALLGQIGSLGVAGLGGVAVAGVAGLTYGIFKLSDAMRDSSKVNLEKIETMQEELQATDDLISRFDELQDKNALTTDEMLRYMDILAELQQTNAPDKIKELTTEQEDLLEKSGFTNDEMEEFLDLNDDVIEKAPATSKAISSQGEAYAENTLALKEYSQEQRNILEAEVQQQLNDAINEHAQTQRDLNKLIAEAKELDKERIANQDEQKKNMQEQTNQKEVIRDIEQQINDLADAKDPKDFLELERLKTSLALEQDTLREMKHQEEELDRLAKGLTDKYIKNQENLDLTREELAELDNVRFKYEEIILSQLDLNYEKGQGLKAVETQIESLSKEKEKLDELRYSGELNTQEYQDQVDKINTQISKLQTAKSELENINEVAGRTIYQSRVVNVKFHAQYSGFQPGDSANIGLVGGGGHQRYAKGTDY